MTERRGSILSSRLLTLATAALIACAVLAFAGPAFAATFDPLNVIPYDTWRASSSMSVSDIQAFLNAQAGPLKSVVTVGWIDPATGAPQIGHPAKSAAQIIWDAARAWNLNPKIILSTLQKEQSLITTSNSANAARLVKAMGCGVYGAIDPKTHLTTNRYPGFGSQIWNGARVLSTYETTYHWLPGLTKTVTAYKSVDATKSASGTIVHYLKTVSYATTIKPKNASTFALYTYTPYYPQKLVWDVYVRYFGDPQSPARMRPVYRFKNRATGAYYYTSSEGTRYTMTKASATWSYVGVSFTIDASSTANTSPLYRMYNSSTRRYYYTTSATKKAALLKAKPHVWTLSGTVGLVSTTATTGALPVYRLENKHTHAFTLTTSAKTKAALSTGSRATDWYRGITFYVGVSQVTTTPVGP